jgi:hypothetical protein
MFGLARGAGVNGDGLRILLVFAVVGVGSVSFVAAEAIHQRMSIEAVDGTRPADLDLAPAWVTKRTSGHIPSASGCSLDAGSRRDGWVDAARGFGQTFTRTSLGQQEWYAAMSSWLTDDQARLYRDISIQQIPAGYLDEIHVDDPGERLFTRGELVYNTGMVLDVGLAYVESAGSWLVASVVPADSANRDD